jgi:hypothetical protein
LCDDWAELAACASDGTSFLFESIAAQISPEGAERGSARVGAGARGGGSFLMVDATSGRGKRRASISWTWSLVFPAASSSSSTYQAIERSRSGNCVHVNGQRMPDGRISVDAFKNLDRE